MLMNKTLLSTETYVKKCSKICTVVSCGYNMATIILRPKTGRFPNGPQLASGSHILPRNVVKRNNCYENVCPSVCHTRASSL